VSLSLSLAEQLPTVLADENKLVQALVNLCINAIHAMPDGGTLMLSTKDVGDKVEISVADTGVGIADEDIDKIFLPFFTKKEAGLGFGLSIVQRIIEDHGGQITCRSRIGQGTVFDLRLPIDRSRKPGVSDDRIAADR
jgi:signal transduction histidine kinase